MSTRRVAIPVTASGLPIWVNLYPWRVRVRIAGLRLPLSNSTYGKLHIMIIVPQNRTMLYEYSSFETNDLIVMYKWPFIVSELYLSLEMGLMRLQECLFAGQSRACAAKGKVALCALRNHYKTTVSLKRWCNSQVSNLPPHPYHTYSYITHFMKPLIKSSGWFHHGPCNSHHQLGLTLPNCVTFDE